MQLNTNKCFDLKIASAVIGNVVLSETDSCQALPLLVSHALFEATNLQTA